VQVQVIAVALAISAIPAWAYWEFTIWHRRRRGILPPQPVRRKRRRGADGDGSPAL
jgi:hypothetical protein